MKASSNPSGVTLKLLRVAVTELRSRPDSNTMSSRFASVHDVANHLEKLTNQLEAGNSEAGRELYLSFVATSHWDDALGSHELGNQLCEALSLYWHA